MEPYTDFADVGRKIDADRIRSEIDNNFARMFWPSRSEGGMLSDCAGFSLMSERVNCIVGGNLSQLYGLDKPIGIRRNWKFQFRDDDSSYCGGDIRFDVALLFFDDSMRLYSPTNIAITLKIGGVNRPATIVRNSGGYFIDATASAFLPGVPNGEKQKTYDFYWHVSFHAYNKNIDLDDVDYDDSPHGQYTCLPLGGD